MATDVIPHCFNQSAISQTSLVKTSYLQIASASRSGGTETHISEAPMSMPPALRLITGMSCGFGTTRHMAEVVFEVMPNAR